MEYSDRELWITGKRGAGVCLNIIHYENGAIIASAEDERVTGRQIERALTREYPGKSFRIARDRGYIYARHEPQLEDLR